MATLVLVLIRPKIGYPFAVDKRQAYINLRAYKEFWAQRRAEEHAAIATINKSLGK